MKLYLQQLSKSATLQQSFKINKHSRTDALVSIKHNNESNKQLLMEQNICSNLNRSCLITSQSRIMLLAFLTGSEIWMTNNSNNDSLQRGSRDKAG